MNFIAIGAQPALRNQVPADPSHSSVADALRTDTAALRKLLCPPEAKANFAREIREPLDSALFAIADSIAGSTKMRQREASAARVSLANRLRENCAHWRRELAELEGRLRADENTTDRPGRFIAVLASAWSNEQLELLIPYYQDALDFVEGKAEKLAARAMEQHPRIRLSGSELEERDTYFVDLESFLAGRPLTAPLLQELLDHCQRRVHALRRQNAIIQTSDEEHDLLVYLLNWTLKPKSSEGKAALGWEYDGQGKRPLRVGVRLLPSRATRQDQLVAELNAAVC